MVQLKGYMILGEGLRVSLSTLYKGHWSSPNLYREVLVEF